MSIGVDHLEAFIAVVRHGSQREAANDLGCTQSAISKRISFLETWLGKLLLTSDSPKELTENGKVFLPVAEQVVALLTQAQAQFESASPPQKTSAKNLRV